MPDHISLHAVSGHGPLGTQQLRYLSVSATSGSGQYRLLAASGGSFVAIVGRPLDDVNRTLHRLFVVE